MPRQKGILPLPLIIYTSFFFFPSSPRETVTHNFLIRYRVSWRKEEWKKDLLTKPKYGRRSADIPSQRVHRDASSLRNRLISFSSSVASLPPPSICALMRISPLDFSQNRPFPLLSILLAANPAKISKNFVSNAFTIVYVNIPWDQCVRTAFRWGVRTTGFDFRGGGGCKLTITSEQCCGTMLQARIERLSFDQKIISSFFIGGNEIVGGEGELKLVHGERHCRKNQVCRGNVFSFFFFFSSFYSPEKKKNSPEYSTRINRRNRIQRVL